MNVVLQPKRLASLVALLASLCLPVLGGAQEPAWWAQARTTIAAQETAGRAMIYGGLLGQLPPAGTSAEDVILKPVTGPAGLAVVAGASPGWRPSVMAWVDGSELVPLGGFPAPDVGAVWRALLSRSTDQLPKRLLWMGRRLAELASDWGVGTVLPYECLATRATCADTAAAAIFSRQPDSCGECADAVTSIQIGSVRAYIVQVAAIHRDLMVSTYWDAQHWVFVTDGIGNLLAWQPGPANKVLLRVK